MNRRDCLGLGLAALGVALGGCQTQAPRSRYPQLTYAHLGTFRFEASRVEIVDEFRAPLQAPNIEHLMPIPPDRTLRQWATDRLAASGASDRYVRFVIRDAKVIETELRRTPGLTGQFTKDQSQRYDLSMAVTIEVREERANYRAGFADASATRSRTVREDITVNEREKVWFDMVEAAMKEIDAELDRQIRGNLARFLSN